MLLHRSNLTTLTLQSDAAIKELQQKKEKVSLELENVLVNKLHCVYTHWAVCVVSQSEKILRSAEMCRKLETEEEKV